MSSSYSNIRNRLLLEALMNSKFYKDKKNFVLKENNFFDFFSNLGQGEMQHQAAGGFVPSDQSYEAQRTAGQQVMTTIQKVGEKVELGELEKFFGHAILDLIGTFDPEPATDLANAAWYYKDKEYLDAFLTAIGAIIPVIFDIIGKGAKYSLKLLKITALSIPTFTKTMAKISEIVLTNSDRIFSVINFCKKYGTRSPQLMSLLTWLEFRVLHFRAYAEVLESLEKSRLKNIDEIIKMTEDFFGPGDPLGVLGKFVARQGPQHYGPLIKNMLSGKLEKPLYLFLIELGLALGVVYLDIENYFDQKVQNLIYQLQNIDLEFSQKAATIAATYKTKSMSGKEIIKEKTYAEMADAVKLLYLLEVCGNDVETIAAVLSKMPELGGAQISSNLRNYIDAAYRMQLITMQQGRQILEAYEKSKIPASQAQNENPEQVVEKSSILLDKLKKFIANLKNQTDNAQRTKHQVIRYLLNAQFQKGAELSTKSSKNINFQP